MHLPSRILRHRLRNKHKVLLSLLAFAITTTSLTSCVKDFDIGVKKNAPTLVVEGYINTDLPDYNYVILSRSMDYYAPEYQSLAVAGARVTITEGEVSADKSITWDPSTTVQLIEVNLPQLPEIFRKGVYFDPRLATDPSNALRGKTGRSYLLEIESEGKHYSAVTTLLKPVPIDSLTCGYSYVDADDMNKEKARVTIHYEDPDTLGNSQVFYWQTKHNKTNFGWGGMGTGWRNSGADDLVNGESIHLTRNTGFDIGDTVRFYMGSVTRDVYDFWETFRAARNNEGPFATPVSLLNRIQGENVTGCFTGLSLSTKSVVIHK